MNNGLSEEVGYTEFKGSSVGRSPVEWAVKNFFEVSDVIDSLHQTPPFSSVGFPMVRVSDIKQGKINLENTKKVDREVYLQFTKKYLPVTGDLLISRVGSYGVCSIVDTEKKFCLGQNAAIIHPTTISSKFLYYWIYSSSIYEQIENEVAGSSYKSLSLATIRKLKVAVPPLPEQEKIATILWSVDEVIETTETQINKLKDLKKGMMNALLTKGIGHTEFKDSAVGRIPVGWEAKTISDISSKVGSGVTPRGGASVYLTQGIKFIRSQNVYSDGLRLNEVAFISQEIHNSMNASKLKEGDVLLNITGASIGRSTFVPKEFGEGNINQHVCIIRSAGSVESKFLSYWLNSDFGQNQIFTLQAGGNREGLNFQQIRAMIISLPPLPEQQKIAEILSSIDTNIEQKQTKLTQTKNLKKSLMAGLLTGRVRVRP